jgi:chromosome segregation ATPase
MAKLEKEKRVVQNEVDRRDMALAEQAKVMAELERANRALKQDLHEMEQERDEAKNKLAEQQVLFDPLMLSLHRRSFECYRLRVKEAENEEAMKEKDDRVDELTDALSRETERSLDISSELDKPKARLKDVHSRPQTECTATAASPPPASPVQQVDESPQSVEAASWGVQGRFAPLLLLWQVLLALPLLFYGVVVHPVLQTGLEALSLEPLALLFLFSPFVFLLLVELGIRALFGIPFS